LDAIVQQLLKNITILVFII